MAIFSLLKKASFVGVVKDFLMYFLGGLLTL